MEMPLDSPDGDALGLMEMPLGSPDGDALGLT